MKAERPGPAGALSAMQSGARAGAQCGWPGAQAPIPFLRFGALGARLAVEAAKICATPVLAPPHLPARHGAGLVMLHEGELIPLVDFRTGPARGAGLRGAQLLVALVHGRRFALAVDGLQGRTGVRYGEIRMPAGELARQVPYLAGSVWRDGAELLLVDVERLLGPAIRAHLLKTG